jgi:hypothetical protein
MELKLRLKLVETNPKKVTRKPLSPENTYICPVCHSKLNKHYSTNLERHLTTLVHQEALFLNVSEGEAACPKVIKRQKIKIKAFGGASCENKGFLPPSPVLSPLVEEDEWTTLNTPPPVFELLALKSDDPWLNQSSFPSFNTFSEDLKATYSSSQNQDVYFSLENLDDGLFL